MNLHRYDMLLELRNAREDLGDPLAKCVEELAELIVAISHLRLEAREGAEEQVADEMADCLLTMRGAMLALKNEALVKERLEFKARRLAVRVV